MEVVLYTICCPACNVLESKLQSQGIDYVKNESEDAIRELGYDRAPLLSVDGKVMDFSEAIQFLKTL